MVWMTNPNVSVVAVAHPLYEELSAHPFSGHILGLFNRACNLIDANHRLITLTSPAVGNGPFSIVIKGIDNFADVFEPQQAVFVTHQDLTIGEWHTSLAQADLWEPKILWPPQMYVPPPSVMALLKPYTTWPHLPIETRNPSESVKTPANPSHSTSYVLRPTYVERGTSVYDDCLQRFSENTQTPIVKRTTHLARRAATELAQTIAQNKNIEEAVTQLAGLGSGLTPAGDDYLVGVMAALWLTGRSDLPPKIASVASSRTTTFSAAFLRAAGCSRFTESWHKLIEALLNEDNLALRKAVNRISQFGATSGTDALAGFATTLLS